MPKYELKTKKNNASVMDFLNAIEDEKKRKQAKELLSIFKNITKKKPKMWGSSIIGFGEYSYTSKSGIEGEWMLTGFSPRKQNFSLYLLPCKDDWKADLQKLGPHKTGKACLYIKNLDDINITELKKLIKKSWNESKKKYLI